MCEYCKIWKEDNTISGENMKVNKTSALQARKHSENLEVFIMRNKADEYAGIMIGTYEGWHYIDINYCPMCGRKI